MVSTAGLQARVHAALDFAYPGGIRTDPPDRRPLDRTNSRTMIGEMLKVSGVTAGCGR
jgi:hypothetical protein